MKSHSTISSTALATILGLALAAGIVSTRARADQWDERTIITVNQPIQVRDTLLDPGTYVLKLYNSGSERHIVQIYTGDESRMIGTVQATAKYRPRPADRTEFTYWETPAGTARALRTWFYPGETIGQEFAYPNKPAQLAMLEMRSTPPPEGLNTQPAPAAPAQPQAMTPAPEPAPASEPNQHQPAEVAEASAAPGPSAAESEPAPAPEPAAAPAQAPSQTPQDTANQPAGMPKTASPYPLMGLCGLFSLGLGGLLRLVRSS
jgi:hypothetical protein